MLLDASAGSAAVITAEMMQPLIDTINANTGVLLPVGITCLGIMVGISLIPRIVYKFM